MEAASKVDAVVFDKTGTLTTGELVVVDIVSLPSHGQQPLDSSALLRLCASAERGSEHPIGRAICKRARDLNIRTSEPRDFNTSSGMGLECEVNPSLPSPEVSKTPLRRPLCVLEPSALLNAFFLVRASPLAIHVPRKFH